MTFAPIAVSPRVTNYDLLLTLELPLSHHDPAEQTDSNRQLFNRQRQLRAVPVGSAVVDQATVDHLCAVHPVPADIEPLFGGLSFPEFAACALVRLFLDLYNHRDGEGLLSELERYRFLETRLRTSAVASSSLRALWNRLCRDLQVGIHSGDDDGALLSLLALPAPIQQMMLRTLADEYRSVVALARHWHATAKRQNEQYAAAVGQEPAGAAVVLAFRAAEIPIPSTAAQVLDVPAVSGNSLRHQVVRAPAWQHLCERLDLAEATPGMGPVPAGVEALFVNGGNIAAGAKPPSTAFALALRARAAYPILDLLGGVTDSFDLGESRLKVAGWLVCLENRAALRGTPAYDLPAATVSAYNMLDDVTLTRQATLRGVGQMIYSFETLCRGAQVLCRLSLTPYTPLLTRGALLAAVHTYIENGPTVGGQSARGFGHCRGEWLGDAHNGDNAREAYEEYLAANRESLRAGLVDGTLGTGVRLLT